MNSQKDSLIEAFQRRYGGDRVPAVYKAPGRVNLVGEHTDYNLGLVLPIALDLACYVAAAPADHGQLRIYSDNLNDERAWDAAGIANLQPSGDWSDYVAGVAVALARAGYQIPPADLYISSTVPVGAGLSSSAALEVAAALALLGDQSIDPVELAKLARTAEGEFAGMPCGIMDQYVSIFGQEHCALKIDCRSLEFEPQKLPPDAVFLLVDSRVQHELAGSAYRDRVSECEQAVDAIRRQHPEVESLRDATLEMIEPLAEPLRGRARHVVTEIARVEEFLAASRVGNLERMGRILTTSHASLRDDYEVSCEELNFLVSAALAIPGVLGARMTGGGFGGCTLNLLAPGRSQDFIYKMGRAYRQRFGLEAEFHTCIPSAGARRIA